MEMTVTYISHIYYLHLEKTLIARQVFFHISCHMNKYLRNQLHEEVWRRKKVVPMTVSQSIKKYVAELKEMLKTLMKLQMRMLN